MGDLDSTRLIRGPAHPAENPAGGRRELAAGAVAGEYVIRGVLATGGHGAVYEAEHRVLGRRAAIKVLHAHLVNQGEMLQRFVREARVVNQIRHPNIVDVYDYGMLSDGSPYYVMELLAGMTLSAALQLRGRLSPARALAYLEPVCAALDAAHRAGVVHRDLKASNIAVVEDGDSPKVKLLDFGIAKLLQQEPGDAGLTVAGQRLGTPYAMSPEQIRGTAVDRRADVYALGVLLYQLLTGEYPFRSHDDLEVERLHLTAPPPRPGQTAPVSPAVDAVVLRCLEKEPERRYQDVPAFIAALREAVGAPGADGREKPGSWAVNAVALYLELELDDSAHEDDAVLARVAELLDGAERDLLAARFLLPLQTGTAVLGVRVLSEEPELAALERREALEVAERLHHGFGPQTDPRVRLHLCVHVEQAEVRRAAAGLEIAGGPIARVADWVVRDGGRLALTQSAVAALSNAR